MTHKLTATKHSKCQDWVHQSIPIITTLIYSTRPSNLIIWAGLKWLTSFVLQLGCLLSRHRLSAFVICSIRRTWDKWLMELDWKKRSNNTQNPKAQCPIHCELNLICFWTVTVLLRVTFSHPTWCHRQWQLGLCGRNRTELNTDTNTRHYYNLGSKTLSKA